MKTRKIWLSVGGFLSVAAAAYTLADPIPFPENGIYKFDFETDPFDSGWTLDAWVWDFMPLSVEEMTDTGDGDGQVRPSSSGLDDFEFADDGADYPLAPLVEAGGYPALQFSGESWLVNGPGIPDDDGEGVFGSALLEFIDLPDHGSLSIAMKLGAGGSIDTDDGPFDVLVDGKLAYTFQFTSGGGNLNADGATRLATGANLTTLYREEWNDNGGAGPSGETDRFALAWTLDSAYDITALSQLTAIPHTSDELSIEFLHHLSSGVADEHVAVDDLMITLSLENPPPPNNWPGGDTYAEDFTSISKAWKLNQWSTADVMSGVSAMTGLGNGNSLVRRTEEPDGFGEEAFSEGEPVYPLEALLDAQSYHEIDPRFDGKWLGTNASSTHNGTAVLFFEKLPMHDGIDLDFVLAATDSFDADDIIPDSDGGNFQVLVDGEVAHETRFHGADGLVDELITQANISPNYREQWNGDIDVGPLDADDRSTVGWTLDSGYDYTAFFDEDGENPISHTADTITISFVHGLNGPTNDESIGIDAFQLKLLNVTDFIFQITSLEINPETNAVTIEWTSADGKTYTVQRSFDVQAWDELADGVDVGTYEDTSVPAGTAEAYYRVLLEE